MIKIENVNKYFNKHKKNQIHVINNTTLTFEDNGLVALLGPSGSGKTTLLNTIGGLDKVNKGKIYINAKRITRRTSSTIDNIRNLNIGYIFQDYLLIDDMTVFDNVALVLKMINIKDKEEIKKRVNYVLEIIGMFRYRNRLAGMLSGGERQRVGIARAIVKNPSIIIADEPTGNLDSKNTIEVMNIIKSISRDKLVILVTHEKDLAYFYASRIIELKDGKVESDNFNSSEGELDYKIDNRIYLKDIENKLHLTSDNVDIKIYNETNNKISLNIVVTNGNIYLETKNNEKLELVNETSSIEFVNDNYKKINKNDYESYRFDFNKIINQNIKQKYKSILNPFTLIINGFKKIFDYTFLKKILLLGFVISGMFILYSISNLFGITNIKDEKFVTQNKNYLNIVMKNINVNEYLQYEKKDNINYILPGNSKVIFKFDYKDYYQTYNISDNLSGSLSSVSMLTKSDIVSGRMPQNKKEIVVDIMSINNMFESNVARQAGVINVKDVIGRSVHLDYIGDYQIVGICDKKSPSIYTENSEFINILSNTNEDIQYNKESSKLESLSEKIVDYTLLEGIVSLKKGKYPVNDYEVMISEKNSELYKIGKYLDTKINDQKLKVVGYYHDNLSREMLLVNFNTVKYNLIKNSENITVYPKDKELVLNEFHQNKINIEDSYEKARKEYISQIKDTIIVTLVIAGIILTISLVEIFLMIRSTFLSRIKEIGILRAIGLKRKDICKMFLGEIIAITSTASLSGYAIMAYILKGLVKLPLMKDQYLLNMPVLVISIILIYTFNILIGLLPVFNTLKKTPAEILSRTDI